MLHKHLRISTLHTRTYLLPLLCALLCTACSTQKNTAVSRRFHHITAYYNYYYNARDIHQLALKKAEKEFSYNYTLPLPVLLLGEQQVQSSVAGDMDRAIEKCTNLISKHSITVKPAQPKKGSMSAKEKEFYNQNEFVRWAREAWLLAAESQAWKGDADKASLSFEHVALRFPNTPMAFAAQVWQARMALLQGNFVDAQSRLDDIQKNRKRPTDSKFEHLLESTYAHMHQLQGNTQGTIEHLQKALQHAKGKPTRLRYTYLLAQLQQQQGRNTEAAELYKKAQRLNPPYDMAFSIKLNLIALGGTKGEALKRALLKLAHDDKNSDYLDHIYYTLGNMERQDGNMEQAIEYYKMSAQSSTTNNTQKGMSYLVLADYYFDKPNYPQAQSYYDSTIAVLDRSYPGYEQIAHKSNCLNGLVEQLNTVQQEDSLLRVAKMPSTERNALITSIINKIKEEEQALQQQQQDDRQRSMQYQQNQRYGGNLAANDGSGKWYFYNQNSLAYGQSEFQMKWGKRKLEDNWRRKNRTEQPSMSIADNQGSTDPSGTTQQTLSNKSPEYYLANLPTTDSLQRIANERIKAAMLRIAEIYQLELHDSEAAQNAYIELAKRFSTDEQAPMAYYNAYKLATEQGRTAEAQSLKATLTSRYPQSSYAKLLANPAYVEHMRQQQREVELHYQQAYALFAQGNHSAAATMAREGRTKHSGTAIAPKYALLEAIASGRSAGLPTMQRLLNDLIQAHPNTPEALHAQQLLTAAQAHELQLAASGSIAPTDSSSTAQRTAPNYAAPKGEHLLVALVPKGTDINQLKFNIISFNVDYFIDADLSVNSTPFSDFVELISVSGLADQRTAMRYLKQLAPQQRSVFAPLLPEEYQVYIISTENLDILLNDKSIADYMNFFKQNY